MSWSTGLFDCTKDIKQAIDTCCCFPCATSRQLTAIEDSKPDTFTLAKCILPGACPGGACAVCYVRRKLVDRYHIEEGLVTSILTGWICAGCAACQHHRELTKRNCWPGGTFLHTQPGNYDMA